jgi:hypothetical protein
MVLADVYLQGLVIERFFFDPRQAEGCRQDSRVQPVPVQLFDDAVGAQLFDEELDARIAPREAPEEQREQKGGDRRNHTEPVLAAQIVRFAVRQRFEPPHLVEDDPGLLDEGLPLFRRKDRLLPAVEERHSELVLELLELSAESRLRHVGHRRRAAEVAALVDRDHVLELGNGRHGSL